MVNSAVAADGVQDRTHAEEQDEGNGMTHNLKNFPFRAKTADITHIRAKTADISHKFALRPLTLQNSR